MKMNKIDSINLIQESFKEMIFQNPLKKSPDLLSIAKLFGRPDLTHSEKIQLGIRMEQWINFIVDNHKGIVSIKGKNSNLWMDTKTNKIVFSGNGKGLKDIDILFNIDGTTYYLEAKTNLTLDT